jgi:hypothetical protein
MIDDLDPEGLIEALGAHRQAIRDHIGGLIGDAVAVAVVPIAVATIAIARVIAAEAPAEPSIAKAVAESSTAEAAAEPSASEASMEASAAEAAMRAPTTEPSMEPSASTAAKASYGWGRFDRNTDCKGGQRSADKFEERCMHRSISRQSVLSPEAVGEVTWRGDELFRQHTKS